MTLKSDGFQLKVRSSASRFARLGVYLFDTETTARLYRDYLMAKRP